LRYRNKSIFTSTKFLRLQSRTSLKMGKDGDPAPRTAPADFDGPIADDDRNTTDLLGTVVFSICTLALSVLGFYASTTNASNGGTEILFNPMDFDGNLCGTNSVLNNGTDMTDFPNLVFVNNRGGGVCVKECPTLTNLTDVRTLLTYNGVYQEDPIVNVTAAADYVQVANYSTSITGRLRTCDKTLCPTDPAESWLSKGVNMDMGFATYAVDTFEIIQRRCLSNPKATLEVESLVAGIDSSLFGTAVDDAGIGNFINQLYGDIFETRFFVTILGFLVSLVLGFGYTQILRIPGVVSLMVWGSILGTIGILIGTGVFVNQSAKDWDAEEPTTVENRVIVWTKALAYFLWALSGIVFLLTLFLRKAIMLAIAVIKQAGRAIGAMPVLTFYPVGQSFLVIGWVVLVIYYAVHIASTGTVTLEEIPGTDIVVPTYEFTSYQKRVGWYLLFVFFWFLEYLKALAQITIALCISKWYFTRDKNNIGTSTFTSSYWTAIRYHSGTAAVGALLIAIVRVIRTMISFVQSKAEAMNNKVGQAILCCCQCCLYCFENALRFLNKSAYIQTAIFGTSFCTSAREAFFLILRNAGRIGSISYVSAVLVFVGRLFVAIVTTCIAYIVINNQFADDNLIHSAAGPAALVFVFAYVVGDLFLDIFEMATETILQCFIADEEMFDGDSGYADGDLRKWFDDHEENERKIMG